MQGTSSVAINDVDPTLKVVYRYRQKEAKGEMQNEHDNGSWQWNQIGSQDDKVEAMEKRTQQ